MGSSQDPGLPWPILKTGLALQIGPLAVPRGRGVGAWPADRPFMKPTHRLLTSTLALALTGCVGVPDSRGIEARDSSTPDACARWDTQATRLHGGLDLLRDHFQAGRGRIRVIVFPDTGGEGLAALASGLANAVEPAAIQVSLVWSREPSAEQLGSELLGGFDVRSFVDVDGIASRTFARFLIPVARLGEAYLLYGPGSDWLAASSRASAPPRPDAWWHRMGRLARPHFVADHSELAELLALELNRPAGR